MQGPSPQSGARHAAQLCGCQPGLVGLIICIQSGHPFVQTARDLRGQPTACTPDSELIWPSGCHNRGWVP